MIIKFKDQLSTEVTAYIENVMATKIIDDDDQPILVTSSSVKEVPQSIKEHVDTEWLFDNDIQLSSRQYKNQTRCVNLGGVEIGGNTKNTLIIAGPCSVESKDQIDLCASYLSNLGLKVLRGGCFKPRTSPYSFQGLGVEGLSLLRTAGDNNDLSIITEVKDATHVDQVIQTTDIIQIGAKAMYDHGILHACSKVKKPVLLKRGFGTTLQEFVQAAEFILCGGNPNVILCERGIRTFENNTRFTLDLCGVAFLKEKTNLPIVLDPSHAMGYAYGVADLSRACVAMGIDGLLVEVHPDPPSALSDAAQQLTFEEFSLLYKSLHPVAAAIGRSIV